MPEQNNTKNEKIKLSVAIPIYNGARYIRESLDSIIYQLDSIDEEIEILISDNASTDQTPEIIKEYKEKYPGILSYFRNDQNISGEKNTDLAVRRSKGEYVWLFTDDDVLIFPVLKKVLNVLNAYSDLSWIFVNYARYNHDLSSKISTVIDIPEDCYCENGEDFFKISRFANTALSSNIVRKRDWENTYESIKNITAQHIQTVLPIYILKYNKSYIISSQLIKFRSPENNKPRWMENKETYLVLGLNMLHYFYEALERNNYSYKLKKLLIKCLRYNIIINILFLKCNGDDLSKRTVCLIKRSRKKDFNLYIVYFFCLYAPGWLMRIIYTQYKALKNIHNYNSLKFIRGKMSKCLQKNEKRHFY